MAVRPGHGLGCHSGNHVGRVLSAAAAEAAASRKEVKYSDLPASISFQPIAVETLGPINESAVDFLRELGRRISSKFQEERQTAYLFQRLSVTVQRYNAVILHDTNGTIVFSLLLSF